MTKTVLSLVLIVILYPITLFAQEATENDTGTPPRAEATDALTGPAGEERAPDQGKTTAGESPDTAPTQTAPQPAPVSQAAQITAVAKTPAPVAREVQFADKVAVEQLVGEILADEYYNWRTRGKYHYSAFRDYVYVKYRKSKRAGIVFMSVLGTAGVAAMASSAVFFLNAKVCPDAIFRYFPEDGEYYNVPVTDADCLIDKSYILAGASLLGGGAALAVTFFTVGAVKTARSRRKMHMLDSAPGPRGGMTFEGLGLSMSAANLPSGAHLTFSF